MNEYQLQRIKSLLKLIFFGFCLWLVVDGQRHIGYAGFFRMMVGLCGLLILLWLYNRGFKKKSHHSHS